VEITTIRVLIVDDDPNQAILVKDILRLNGDFDIHWVNCVQDLMQYLEKHRPDIILLDYRLPDGTGIEVLEDFHKRGNRIPVIIITGQGDERLAVRSLQLGAADYLIKGDDYVFSLPALIHKTIKSQKLQESIEETSEKNRYYALLLNNVRDAIVVWDTNGIITHWNPAAAKLFGHTLQEQLGQPVEENYLPYFTPQIIVPRGEATGGQEVSRLYKNEKERSVWVSSRVNALRDYGAGGRLIGFMDVSRDITSRVQAEEALRTERNFVATVLDTVGALVVVLDTAGKIVRLNRAFEELTGYSGDELRGRVFWEIFIAAEEVEPFKASFYSIDKSSPKISCETQLIIRDGPRRTIAWSNTAILNEKNQAEFFIATGIDLTDKEIAEQALRESEARYRAVSELVSDFVYALRVDKSGKVKCDWVTDSFNQYHDFDLKETDLRDAWFNLIHPEDKKTFLQMVKALKMGQSHVCELRLIGTDQKVYWVRNYARPIIDSKEGRLVRVYGAAEDITEKKQMEMQIQAAQVHLTNSARLAAIGELASGVAHHINNPLTAIIAETQILQQSLPDSHPAHESVDLIQKAGWRVQKAVQQLLDFSRPATSTLTSLSINDTVETALSLVGEHIQSFGIRLEIDLGEDLPYMRGNLRQLVDLWVNLLLLARDACGDGVQHKISLHTQKDSRGMIVAEIGDDGETIPPEEMKTLFEPNFIKPVGGRGTGIELSICQEIIRQHFGVIEATSCNGEGTLFRIAFPTG
jgi:two-component system NtrC family sensor kinase